MSKRVVVVCGVSGRGKSTSLINMDNTLHLICEEGKDLPFSLKGKMFFKSAPVTTPQQVLDTITWAEDKTDYNTIVIDGLNYLMDMYESQFVFGSADSRGEWGGYQQFFKDLVHAIAVSTKDFILCAHVAYKYNEQDMVMDARIPVKGALAKAGLEASFTTILGAERVKLEDLEKYPNALLNITDEEREDGFKYVLQTRPLQNAVNSNVKAPRGMFARNEAYINSDMAVVMRRAHDFYAQ